jgi:osmotically-inducible protein OsmY
MRRTRIWLALLALLAVLMTPTLQAQSTSVQKSAKPEERAPSGLSREIHHQILVLPFYSVFDFIVFTLDGSRVTLSGQVARRNLRAQAEAAVKSIEGVGVVINNIEVLPISPADDELRRAAYRALYEDPTLARYAIQNVPPIHIIVKNSNVTLEGSVDSLSDKNLAALRAGGVANVLGVKNNLVVHPRGIAAEY